MVKITDTNIILMVEDDPDDYFLMNKALSETGIKGNLVQLLDGVELMDYLFNEGQYTDTEKAVKPKLILLDLNMPRMNGLDALKKIKALDKIKDIPVIIFTTSSEKRNIQQCYIDGADDYIVKPSNYTELLHIAYDIKRNWI